MYPKKHKGLSEQEQLINDQKKLESDIKHRNFIKQWKQQRDDIIKNPPLSKDDESIMYQRKKKSDKTKPNRKNIKNCSCKTKHK